MGAQARRCRRLATHATGQTQNTLRWLADDYERRQKAAEKPGSPDRPAMPLGPANDLPE
jgi:hypothetical protein